MRDQIHFVNWIENNAKSCYASLYKLYAAIVFNVLLTSAKTYSSDTDSANNIEHVVVSREHGVRHKEHPFPIPLTVSAHAEQKRAWTHGTNATPSRETSRQTSHISVACYVAVVDVDVDVHVADATSEALKMRE